jgi:hypothetical protein
VKQPRTGKPSAVRTQSTTSDSLSTENPFVVSPLQTASPLTEKPSEYKENISTKKSINPVEPLIFPASGEPTGRTDRDRFASSKGKPPTAIPWNPEQEASQAKSPATPAAARGEQSPPTRQRAGEDWGNPPAEAKPAKKAPTPRDPFASKTLPADAIPNDLLDCQQLLPEWWTVKARGRSEAAFNRACSLLRRHTQDERRQMLETAIIGGYQGLHPPKPTGPRARARNLGGCTPDGEPLVEAMRREGWF